MSEGMESLQAEWGLAPWEFFFNNAKCCKLGNFFSFLAGLGGAWLPWPPPFGAAYVKYFYSYIHLCYKYMILVQ